MLNSSLKNLIDQGDSLFSKRTGLQHLWQELAENFFPEAASFTVNKTLGSDFSGNLMTSYPVIARRELGDGLGAMLRTNDWFSMAASYREVDLDGRQWLERATRIQKRAMYDRKSKFTRATKEGDHFYATFGQCVITVEMHRDLSGLLYRSWHIRDVAWCDNAEGDTDVVHHKLCDFTLAQLNEMFPGKLAPALMERLEKDPYSTHEIRRVVLPSEQYSGERKWNTKFVSLYIDVANATVLEEMGQHTNPYVIPRWRTMPGSQYAHSPAAMTGLPDARLIQGMSLVLLEAGELSNNPPMVANKEIFRSDFPLYAGGVTWADMAYDGKLSDHFAQLTQGGAGNSMPLIQMREEVRDMIANAFYLNKLNLPGYDSKQMTAYEFSQRVQEYIRQVLPLVEPTEAEYNAPLCDRTFDLLMRYGAFGSPDLIPQSLRGAQIEFRFKSPVSEATEKAKVTLFRDDLALATEAAVLDPNAPITFNATRAFREVLEANGSPATWIRKAEDVQTIIAEQDEKQQMAELMAGAQAAAGVAKTAAEAQAASATVH